jgi:hypothetical protein
MTTGQGACWATWAATDPIDSRQRPPAPREPSTIMSAPSPALMSSPAGMPLTPLIVTDSGRELPRAASTLSVSALAAASASAVRSGSPG